ncbi:DBF4 B [Cichlidogyrus casuarinus]|uniref:DBF4 B n=1 Tax=Cichlidogyrus casuarinus TaxID=1844966 RepID=A0ABD2Q1W3_9PLAT
MSDSVPKRLLTPAKLVRKHSERSTLPLKGKIIYIHHESESSRPAALQKIVHRLGGEIADFFSREIPKSGKQEISPKSEQLTSFSSSQRTFSSRRSQIMLAASVSKSPASVEKHDLLTRALQLNIKIYSVSLFMKWVKEMPPHIQEILKDESLSKVAQSIDPEKDKKYSVKPLETPCVKIFDQSVDIRPIYMEKTNYMPWLFSGSPKHPRPSVNETPKENKENICPAKTWFLNNLSFRASTKPVQSKASSKKRSKKRENYEELSGYCECCSVSFKNLKQHLAGGDHQQFAHNDENFRSIDEALRECSNFDEFLRNARQEQRKKEEDRFSETPEMKQYHRMCSSCSRHHIPNDLCSTTHTHMACFFPPSTQIENIACKLKSGSMEDEFCSPEPPVLRLSEAFITPSKSFENPPELTPQSGSLNQSLHYLMPLATPEMDVQKAPTPKTPEKNEKVVTPLHCRKRKRFETNGFCTPIRSSRTAAVVAKEGISLSVKALYSPGFSFRCKKIICNASKTDDHDSSSENTSPANNGEWQLSALIPLESDEKKRAPKLLLKRKRALFSPSQSPAKRSRAISPTL